MNLHIAVFVICILCVAVLAAGGGIMSSNVTDGVTQIDKDWAALTQAHDKRLAAAEAAAKSDLLTKHAPEFSVELVAAKERITALKTGPKTGTPPAPTWETDFSKIDAEKLASFDSAQRQLTVTIERLLQSADATWGKDPLFNPISASLQAADVEVVNARQKIVKDVVAHNTRVTTAWPERFIASRRGVLPRTEVSLVR